MHRLHDRQAAHSFVFKHCTIKEDSCKLVHRRVWSYGAGAQYFMTFINDFSKRLWAYMIKCKDQVYYFQKFHVAIQRGNGCHLKQFILIIEANTQIHLRSTLESMGSNMRGKFQQNGLAKRMNYTICKKERSMLSYAVLPKIF